MISLPTDFGEFHVSVHESGSEHCILISKEHGEEVPFLRIHSSCVFSEALHSNDCDCAQQLQASLKYVGIHGGLIIYCYEEGRGVGLRKKIEAIQLEQKKHMNTAEAFKELGFTADPRTYKLAIDALQVLNIKRVRLASNNPQKIEALKNGGIEVVERIILNLDLNDAAKEYLDKKIEHLGHYEKN